MDGRWAKLPNQFFNPKLSDFQVYRRYNENDVER